MSDAPGITVNEYEGGVLAIDSGYTRECMAACYLLEADDSVAFIETGTNASVPRLLAVLERRGWTVEDVEYVIVTHVHLDHAGGAGTLMAALPRARLLVHPRGARHMIDPSRLEASVRQVYGDETYEREYGALQPIPEERVCAVGDGEVFHVGARALRFVDTPGHAKHHFCVWDEATRGWFTGDTFGLSYREFDTEQGAFVFPTTTPVQFDPAALEESIALLLDPEPRWMYLTHFGRVGDVGRLADQLRAGLAAFVDLARRREGAPDRGQRLRSDLEAWLTQALRAHGVRLPDRELRELLAADVELNAQGIEFWLDHGGGGS